MLGLLVLGLLVLVLVLVLVLLVLVLVLVLVLLLLLMQFAHIGLLRLLRKRAESIIGERRGQGWGLVNAAPFDSCTPASWYAHWHAPIVWRLGVQGVMHVGRN